MNNRDLEDRIVALIVKSLKGELTGEEQQELDRWVSASAQNRLFAERFTPAFLLDELQRFESVDTPAEWRRLQHRREKERVEKAKTRLVTLRTWWLAAAAAVIIVAGVWWINRPAETGLPPVANRYQNEIDPLNRQQALLQLSDGREMTVSREQEGILGREGNTLVRNVQGRLEYEAGATAAGDSLFNTISTPRGAHYRLLLPDGTAVWLNNASSIRFPVQFKSLERRVQVTGEVYVEVQPAPGSSFIVEVGGAEVRAAGTRFNIYQQPKNGRVLTTLLEGALSVSRRGATQALKAGQQVLSQPDGFVMADSVDMEMVSGWRKGQFVFRKANMEEMMWEIQRHYDVEVIYQDSIPYRFEAYISRSVPLSKLLQMLELTRLVQFSLEGRTVTVMKPAS
ncbi:MAG: FecR domain-containing protein [Candidatus Pseudobacter hemicellulosilyticus]|uniref:FecR domain-containing protein n=1 Tax=Candidatus Pseudobacter hemicellulosilyticus TaxID=3121375 RepID=A0AAJ5WVL7_9BACT|nr:MAG: FecR domain-containing protein [Pseudobacter sp.]